MQITVAITLLVSLLGSTAAFAPHSFSSSARAFAVNSKGEWPNTVSVLLYSLSIKRPRDKEEVSNDSYRRNMNGPVKKNATGSAEFVVDLELADEAEVVLPNIKRRGALRSKRSGKNDAAESGAETLEEVEDRLSEFARIKASRRHTRYSKWRDRFNELAEYHKEHGNCNVPRRYSENIKLAQWVQAQRSTYWLYLDGKKSPMTTFRTRKLKSLGFEWGIRAVAWDDCLSELAEYRKIHGHCNVPRKYGENAKLATWVAKQRTNYRLHLEGKTSHMTTVRIQELESLGFEWDSQGAAWEDRLSELAVYRKIYGNCNVPHSYSENTKLGKWVANQRCQYRLQLEGKTSHMTTYRIQELESLCFEWDSYGVLWEVRLSELADYRKEHGHCNVPQRYSENPKLGQWAGTQRRNYRLQLEGNKAFIALPRIQALESLGFEWKPSISRGKQGTPSLDDDARHVHKTSAKANL
jgi:hypothetical protein